MFGKNSVVTSLEMRKRLLLAASDINRELLVHEWQSLAAGTEGVTHKAREFGMFTCSLGSLAAGFSLFRRFKPQATPKPSWLSLVFDGIRFGLSLWAGGVTRRKVVM